LGFHHARAGVVFRGDQLDVILLAATLVGNGLGQFIVETGNRAIAGKHADLAGNGRNGAGSVAPAQASSHNPYSGGEFAVAKRYNTRLCVTRAAPAPIPHGGSMQYIYTMNGVSKTVPPKRQIIKDISLSFFPGAKIGLLG